MVPINDKNNAAYIRIRDQHTSKNVQSNSNLINQEDEIPLSFQMKSALITDCGMYHEEF